MPLQDKIGTTVSEIAREFGLDVGEAATFVDELVASGLALDSGHRRPGPVGKLETECAEGWLAAKFEPQ
jgi:hypothetical protein